MPARAAGPWYVSNSGNDANDCASPTTTCASINAALNKPGFVAGDTVLVATGIYTGTGTEVVLLNKDATLSGGWDTTFITQTGMTTIDGQGTHRGINITTGVNTTIQMFSIENGFINSDSGAGIKNNGNLILTNSVVKNNNGYIMVVAGGISNLGTMTLTNDRIINNQAYTTGGIQNNGVATISNSTVSDNQSGSNAGGIENNGSLTLTKSLVSTNKSACASAGIQNLSALRIENSTVSDNISGLGGCTGEGIYNAGELYLFNATVTNNSGGIGGVRNNSGTVYIRNTILQDCSGTVISQGYNLIQNTISCTIDSDVSGNLTNLDPKLNSLQDNGGPTLTRALLSSSKAINAGNPTGCMGNNGLLDTDQRGFPRVGQCDIGAFEYQGTDFLRQVFLPLIISPRYLGINGHVTFNGTAASGVPLDLRFYNGSAWSTAASTTTSADGSYEFLTAPTLGSGQRYYVRYTNSTDPTRLAIWQTRSLTSYSANNTIAIGDFDIANIPLASPVSGSTVALPNQFSWQVRPATSTDSYEFNLLNVSTGSPWWYTVPPLGYVNNYTLNNLPAGFTTNTWYGWFVAVYSPDGGYGESYYFRYIAFTNTGLNPQLRLPLMPKNISEGLAKSHSIPENAR